VPYKSELAQLDAKAEQIRNNPTDDSRFYLGWPYSRWSSFMFYSPIDDLRSIPIPIYLLHGAADTMVPVESSQYAFDELRKAGKTNVILYIYPGRDHTFNNEFASLVNEVIKCMK
jgi:fermentation-respiration switch protein FrsA (DUF1100 family)